MNTVDDLHKAAKTLDKVLNDKGILVLSFVNKWYMGGILLELARLRFAKAFLRLKAIWGGYSPVKFLPSKCYSVSHIKKVFEDFELLSKKGYSIVHPAWYNTGINQALGKSRRMLLKTDDILNKTFLWCFGEYSLFVFQK